jgi:hypothetical protein
MERFLFIEFQVGKGSLFMHLVFQVSIWDIYIYIYIYMHEIICSLMKAIE